jgi:hypothetical protein
MHTMTFWKELSSDGPVIGHRDGTGPNHGAKFGAWQLRALGELSTERCEIGNLKVQGTKLFLHGRKDAVNKHPASSSVGVSIEHRVQSRTSSSPFAVVSLVKKD